MKITVALNKYRLVYNSMMYTKVQYAIRVQTDVHHQRTYCIWYEVIWNQTLGLLQVVITLLLCCQQGEELDQNMYGMGNRRKNVDASSEVCMLARLPYKHIYRRGYILKTRAWPLP